MANAEKQARLDAEQRMKQALKDVGKSDRRIDPESPLGVAIESAIHPVVEDAIESAINAVVEDMDFDDESEDLD